MPLQRFSAGQIRDGFREFARLSQACRFANCTHLHEPGCAVLAAIGDEVQKQRWESYRAMVENP